MLGYNDIETTFVVNPVLYAIYCIVLLLFFFFLMQPITLTLLIDSFDEVTKTSCHHSDLGAKGGKWTM